MKLLFRFKKLALIKALFCISFGAFWPIISGCKMERGHKKHQGMCQSLWANHNVTIQTFFFFIYKKESHAMGEFTKNNSVEYLHVLSLF